MRLGQCPHLFVGYGFRQSDTISETGGFHRSTRCLRDAPFDAEAISPEHKQWPTRGLQNQSFAFPSFPYTRPWWGLYPNYSKRTGETQDCSVKVIQVIVTESLEGCQRGLLCRLCRGYATKKPTNLVRHSGAGQ